MCTTERETFIDAPAYRAMVYDYILLIQRPKTVPTISAIQSDILVAEAETHETNNHVVGLDGKRIVGHADAVAWSGLACNSDITVAQIQFRVQVNIARDVKHYGSGTGLVTRPAERTGLIVVLKGGHMIDLASATAGGVAAIALGSGKCLKFVNGFPCRTHKSTKHCYKR